MSRKNAIGHRLSPHSKITHSFTNIQIPNTSADHPKIRFRLSPEKRLAKRSPMKMPKAASSDMDARKSQSTGWLNAPPRNPTSEFKAMIGNADPTATLKRSPAKSIRAGRIRKPPPTPASPERKPTPRPARHHSERVCSPGGFFSCKLPATDHH